MYPHPMVRGVLRNSRCNPSFLQPPYNSLSSSTIRGKEVQLHPKFHGYYRRRKRSNMIRSLGLGTLSRRDSSVGRLRLKFLESVDLIRMILRGYGALVIITSNYSTLSFVFHRTLADGDNRGKLNMAEFHVAMGLIYRSMSHLIRGTAWN